MLLALSVATPVVRSGIPRWLTPLVVRVPAITVTIVILWLLGRRFCCRLGSWFCSRLRTWHNIDDHLHSLWHNIPFFFHGHDSCRYDFLRRCLSNTKCWGCTSLGRLFLFPIASRGRVGCNPSSRCFRFFLFLSRLGLTGLAIDFPLNSHWIWFFRFRDSATRIGGCISLGTAGGDSTIGRANLFGTPLRKLLLFLTTIRNYLI
jgi:hypothetical protein